MALAQVPSKSLDFHPPRRLAAQPKAPNCSRPQPRSSGLGQRGGKGERGGWRGSKRRLRRFEAVSQRPIAECGVIVRHLLICDDNILVVHHACIFPHAGSKYTTVLSWVRNHADS